MASEPFESLSLVRPLVCEVFDEWLDEQDERGRLIVDPPHDPTAEEALPGTFAPP